MSWKSISVKIGAKLTVPIDIGKPWIGGKSLANPTSETYKPAPWDGCTLRLSKSPFDKEDPAESLAVRMEDTAYRDLDLSEDRIQSITFGLLQGFPKLEIEGVKKNHARFHTLICRTKTLNYVVSLSGLSLPDDDVVKKLFDSFRLPPLPPSGTWSKWPPVAGNAKFLQGDLTVWAPIQFKNSEDYPMVQESDTKGEAHVAKFGYSSYTVAIVNLPEGAAEKMDDEAIDAIIHKKFDEDEDGDRVNYGDFKTVSADHHDFRSAVYDSETVEGRVDVVVVGNKLYMFSVIVPRGMLDSSTVQQFYSSIKIDKRIEQLTSRLPAGSLKKLPGKDTHQFNIQPPVAVVSLATRAAFGVAIAVCAPPFPD